MTVILTASGASNMLQFSFIIMSMAISFSVNLLWGFVISSDLSDFVSGNQSLEDLGNHKRRQCFNVTIVNDNIPENEEVFTATLEKPLDESLSHIRILPGTVTITVLDNDGKCQ